MKLIRQSEVYLMEEAVTDTIIKGATQRIDSMNQIQQDNGMSNNQDNFIENSKEDGVRDAYGSGPAGVVNIKSYV